MDYTITVSFSVDDGDENTAYSLAKLLEDRAVYVVDNVSVAVSKAE